MGMCRRNRAPMAGAINGQAMAITIVSMVNRRQMCRRRRCHRRAPMTRSDAIAFHRWAITRWRSSKCGNWTWSSQANYSKKHFAIWMATSHRFCGKRANPSTPNGMRCTWKMVTNDRMRQRCRSSHRRMTASQDRISRLVRWIMIMPTATGITRCEWFRK